MYGLSKVILFQDRIDRPRPSFKNCGLFQHAETEPRLSAYRVTRVSTMSKVIRGCLRMLRPSSIFRAKSLSKALACGSAHSLEKSYFRRSERVLKIFVLDYNTA
jgi:hypothetical protein